MNTISINLHGTSTTSPSTSPLHPMTLTIDKMVRIFESMGFSVATGPELETEWNNFDALNVPPDHPARDMQDTFWLKLSKELAQSDSKESDLGIKTDGKPMFDNSGHSTRPVMRTHTSPVQVRYMLQAVAQGRDFAVDPIMIVVPGKVFRNEATDATHEAQFHQMEGLVVGKNISMAQLKGTLLEFFKQFIGPDADIRLRPSFFPFVEPGVEVDVKMQKKDGSVDYVEVLGAGLVHANVLRNCGIDPEVYSGFAFGFGIDRMVMLGTGLTDIRYLYQGDLRINQF